MKKIYVLAACILAFTLAFSCGGSGKKSQTSGGSKEVENKTTPPDMHNAKSSLDYMGRYHGVLPTASGQGMDVCITLHDSTYMKEMIYIGKSEEPIITKGTYSWNDTGNTITLNGEEKPNQYFVAENKLIHLDVDGNRIEGELAEKYILNKE